MHMHFFLHLHGTFLILIVLLFAIDTLSKCMLCLDAASGNTGHGPARSRDRNERGETAMHVAAIKGDQEGIKKLLEQGMSPNVADFAGMCRPITHFTSISFLILPYLIDINML